MVIFSIVSKNYAFCISCIFLKHPYPLSAAATIITHTRHTNTIHTTHTSLPTSPKNTTTPSPRTGQVHFMRIPPWSSKPLPMRFVLLRLWLRPLRSSIDWSSQAVEWSHLSQANQCLNQHNQCYFFNSEECFRCMGVVQ